MVVNWGVMMVAQMVAMMAAERVEKTEVLMVAQMVVMMAVERVEKMEVLMVAKRVDKKEDWRVDLTVA